jgi:hypothetical protein
MAEKGFFERLNATWYFTILFILLLAFFILIALAVFYNTLWVFIPAIPMVIVIPLLFYVDERIEHKKLGRFAVLLPFFFISYFLYFIDAFSIWPILSYIITLLFYIIAFTILMTIATLLCAKYLKPKIKKISE